MFCMIEKPFPEIVTFSINSPESTIDMDLLQKLTGIKWDHVFSFDIIYLRKVFPIGEPVHGLQR